MASLIRLVERFLASFRKTRFEGAMEEELRFHLESLVQENKQNGMSEEQARRSALIAFGGIDRIKEECRDTRWTRWLDQLWQDLHYALRILWRNPLSSIITVVVIAATIGLLCAAYAVLDAVLLRTLPIPHAEQLVVINPTATLPPSIYDVLQQERQNVSQVFGMKTLLTYGNPGNAMRSLGVCVIRGDYFGTIGATPQVGRFISTDEKDPVAVISDRFWRREFGGIPDIVGRRVKLGLLDFTIVGVARPGFVLVEEPYSEWEVTVPYVAFSRSQPTEFRLPLQIIARLKEGRTAGEYEAQLNSLWPTLLQVTLPHGITLDQWRELSGPRAQVVAIPKGINYVLILNQSIPLAIRIVFGLSILIFLSGCLSLTLLATARSVRNRRHIMILSALGGGRWRIQRPFFLETLILSVMGCGLGLVIALWWSKLGASFLPIDEFINWHIRIDGRTITLAFLITLFIIGVISLVTAAFGLHGSKTRVLHSGAPDSRPNVRLRTILLAVQIAISILLGQYALFFTDSFSRLLRVPLGFNPENLHVYTLLTKFAGRDTPENYFPRLLSQIEQLAEVDSATITSGRPPADFPIEYKQPVRTDDGRDAQATVIPISPNYFKTLNMPLLLGRDLSWNDKNTAIVNETLLQKLHPGKDPLSHDIAYGRPGTPLQIIGVAGKMTYFGPRWGDSSIAFVSCAEKLKSLQPGNVIIMVRSKRNLYQLRTAIQNLMDSSGNYYIAHSVDQTAYLSSSMKPEKMLATVAGMFGGLIALLAGIELYAFCNYLLAMRTKELAIRASVGARSNQIAAALLKEVARAFGIGLTLALIVILSGERLFLNSAGLSRPPGFLYLWLATMLVAGITMSAVSIPAMRAVRINLARALRVD